MRISYAAETRTGLVRKRNEDAILVDGWISLGDARLVGQREPAEGERVLCAVFDGMGGHAAGDVASHLAAGQLGLQTPDLVSPAGIDAALQSASQLVASAGTMIPAYAGMGSTVVGLVLSRSAYWLFHAGDSLAFRFINGRLGQLHAPDRMPHPRFPEQSVITQALGQPGFAPTVEEFPIRGPQRLMLCSDGLHDVVVRAAIERILTEPEAEQAAEQLTDLAYEAGAPDNVSVVVMDVAGS